MNCDNGFDHFSFTMLLLLSSMWLLFIGIKKCTNAYAHHLCDFCQSMRFVAARNVMLGLCWEYVPLSNNFLFNAYS